MDIPSGFFFVIFNTFTYTMDNSLSNGYFFAFNLIIGMITSSKEIPPC